MFHRQKLSLSIAALMLASGGIAPTLEAPLNVLSRAFQAVSMAATANSSGVEVRSPESVINSPSVPISGIGVPDATIEVSEGWDDIGAARVGSDGRWSIPSPGWSEGEHLLTVTQRVGNSHVSVDHMFTYQPVEPEIN